MFEPVPDLSTDLEWMLQSGQASSRMLLESLVDEYYLAVFRLAHSILDDPDAARVAVKETFSAALLNVYRYRSATGVKAWLFSLALEACKRRLKGVKARRALKASLPLPSNPADFGASVPSSEEEACLWLQVDSLREKLRLLILLNHVHGWTPAEIARLARQKESAVHFQLQIARRRILVGLEKADFARPDWQDKDLEDHLSRSLQARWPEPQPLGSLEPPGSHEPPDSHEPPHELDRFIASVDTLAGTSGALRSRFASLKEVLLLTVVIAMVAGILWAVNALIPEPSPSRPARSTARPTRIAAVRPQVTPTRSPTLVPTLPMRAVSKEMLIYVVQPGDSLESIAASVGMSADELRSLNHIPQNERIREGQILMIVVGLTPPARMSPTPVTPARQLEPLTLASGSEAIYQRLLQSSSLWNTLWADVLLITHGPSSYVGPPTGYHAQTWISQPRQSLAITGPLDGEPRNAIRVTGFHGYDFNLVSGGLSSYGTSELLKVPELRSLVYPSRSDWVVREGSFNVLRSEDVAGRDTIQVEWVNAQGETEVNLWIDALTGVILREVKFETGGSKAVVSDFRFTRVAFDVDFPPELFDLSGPYGSSFSDDYTGKPLQDDTPAPDTAPAPGHEPLPFQPAPAGFDPSQSRLTFHYAPDFFPYDHDFYPSDARPTVVLFGDRYFLGGLEFGNPWTMICDRSPMGDRIAFVSQPALSPDQDAFLRWFTLSEPWIMHHPMDRVYATHFAFAPDNRWLAVFGHEGPLGPGGIFLLDTQTDGYRRLKDLVDAKSFVWSPDGEYLALIGAERSHVEEEVMVIRISSGEITFRNSIDYATGNTSQDWPMLDWGVDFPIEMGNLDSCSFPPTQ